MLELAGECVKSLDAEISQCEREIEEGVNNDETKDNDDGKISFNEHDDSSGRDKELEGRAQQQTVRKGREGFCSKRENQDELARLRRGRDVMVQDVSSPSLSHNL